MGGWTPPPPSPAGGNGDVDSELSEVQTPLLGVGEQHTQGWAQWGAGLHYPAKQPKLIPLSVYSGEENSGHLSQGTGSPNSPGHREIWCVALC